MLAKHNFIKNFLIMQELNYPVVDIDLFAWERKTSISSSKKKETIHYCLIWDIKY